MKPAFFKFLEACGRIPVLRLIVELGLKIYIIVKSMHNEEFAEYVLRELNHAEEAATEGKAI